MYVYTYIHIDAVETAEREIGLWFKDGATEWQLHSEPWIYE
jgi:hypothetical protein